MANVVVRDPALWRRWRIWDADEDGGGGRYQLLEGATWRDCTPDEVAEIEDRIAHPNKYGWEGA